MENDDPIEARRDRRRGALRIGAFLLRRGRLGAGTFARGVWPIMATPFMPDTEDVDLKSFAKSIRFMRDAGASGVTGDWCVGRVESTP